MTIRKQESILLALTAALQVSEPALARNAPLPDLSGGKVVRLLDGRLQEGDVFLNPPMYEFTAVPVVQIVIAGGTDAERDAAVESSIGNLLTAIGTITDLGGLITDLRPQPPNTMPREFFGAPNMKAAEIEIEVDYFTDTTAG